MSSANLKYVNFASNTWLEWMNLHNDIVTYLNGQVFTNSVSDVSTSNIATANAVNTVHSRAVSVYSYANTVFVYSSQLYDYANSAYATSNTLYSTITQLADYANSYSGWIISSENYRFGVIPWVDANGIVHLGTKIGFHSSNTVEPAGANITYDSSNSVFEFDTRLKVLNGLEIIGSNTVLHISSGGNDIMKVESNGNITGTISGSETIWISPKEMSNSSINTFETSNGSVIPVFDFHQAVYANNGLTISLPKSWDQENVSMRIYGISNSTTENSAVIIVKSRVIGDNEIISHDDSGVRLFCNSNSEGANTLMLSDSDYTELNVENKANTGANNESLIHFSIYRDINDADDNLEVPFRLIGLKIRYNKRQLTDI